MPWRVRHGALFTTGNLKVYLSLVVSVGTGILLPLLENPLLENPLLENITRKFRRTPRFPCA